MGAETQAVSVMEVKSNFDQLRPPDLVSIDLPASRVWKRIQMWQWNRSTFGAFVTWKTSTFASTIYPRTYQHHHSLCQLPFMGCLMAMEAASFIKKHAMKLFFDDFQFPQTFKADEAEMFSDELEESMRRAFQMADLALADDPTVNASSGTTALAPLIFGRLLVVANAGDCRAVLCRKGGAVDMSQDHRPVHQVEKRRVVELGGFIDDGYLNGLLSVSRALGDWDMKLPRGSPSPLVTEAEFRQTVLTEDDKFMIMGCDRIWDVMTSQQAVSLVRRGLRRHDDPQQCARELVAESLLLNTFDNLTVVVVCFSDTLDHRQPRCCSLSAEALCSLKSLLDRRDNSR